MKKETVFVAMSNQKGGVGKSAFTILLASYLHYVKNLNVAVVDCDSPQHSLHNMKERDMDTVMKSDYFKQLMMDQFERINKKAYSIIRSSAETARQDADAFLGASPEHFDLVIVDLPGTVNSQGVITTVVNMDYVITPVTADRMVMQSSLAFSTTVMGFVRKRPDISLKDILIFWNRVDKRAATDVFDAYNKIMAKLNLTVLKTVIPETRRYDKELPFKGRTYFRCTLLPPPAKLLKGSGLEELADELCGIMNL
ncbi:ParA family protein [Alistipes sp. OttesenSCG-928-L06]|nr:ParA family protein [Alistipes sp. OttesenSCG-928-L06]